MKLSDYLLTLTEPLRPRTLCLLRQDEQILLGYKKRGFGMGKYIGIGGKLEPGETIEQALNRELQEEISVTATKLSKTAVLDFYFPEVENPANWNQQVHVFWVDQWDGDPQESEEISPQWFNIAQIPYSQMWADAKFWLPEILQGRVLHAAFLFDQEQQISDHQIADMVK